MNFIKLVDVYQVDFFKRTAKININDQIQEFPIHLVTANQFPKAEYRALLVGENIDSAIAIVFTEQEYNESINKRIMNQQNNL